MSTSQQRSPPRFDHGLRRQFIVESLLREILQGEISAGQHLVTQALSKRFGVSHTPIREALILLAGTGIITLQPNRGAIVRHFGVQDILDISQVRRALECEAIRSACGSIPDAKLQELANVFVQLSALKPPFELQHFELSKDVDGQLHDLIAASCGNIFLTRELGRLKVLFRALRDAGWHATGNRQDNYRITEASLEHLVIVEALLAKDEKRAVRAMSRHIKSAAVYWSRAVMEPGRDRDVAVAKSTAARDTATVGSGIRGTSG